MKDIPPKFDVRKENNNNKNNNKSIIAKNEVNNIQENFNYIGKLVDSKRIIFALFKGQGIEISNSSLNTTIFKFRQ